MWTSEDFGGSTVYHNLLALMTKIVRSGENGGVVTVLVDPAGDGVDVDRHLCTYYEQEVVVPTCVAYPCNSRWFEGATAATGARVGGLGQGLQESCSHVRQGTSRSPDSQQERLLTHFQPQDPSPPAWRSTKWGIVKTL